MAGLSQGVRASRRGLCRASLLAAQPLCPPARPVPLMRRIRAFEDAAEVASQGGVAAWGLAASAKPALVRGPLHLSTGQEAVAAGVC
jgi:hypothetical protein